MKMKTSLTAIAAAVALSFVSAPVFAGGATHVHVFPHIHVPTTGLFVDNDQDNYGDHNANTKVTGALGGSLQAGGGDVSISSAAIGNNLSLTTESPATGFVLTNDQGNHGDMTAKTEVKDMKQVAGGDASISSAAIGNNTSVDVASTDVVLDSDQDSHGAGGGDADMKADTVVNDLVQKAGVDASISSAAIGNNLSLSADLAATVVHLGNIQHSHGNMTARTSVNGTSQLGGVDASISSAAIGNNLSGDVVSPSVYLDNDQYSLGDMDADTIVSNLSQTATAGDASISSAAIGNNASITVGGSL